MWLNKSKGALSINIKMLSDFKKHHNLTGRVFLVVYKLILHLKIMDALGSMMSIKQVARYQP